jgi:hypothetical protein
MICFAITLALLIVALGGAEWVLNRIPAAQKWLGCPHTTLAFFQPEVWNARFSGFYCKDCSESWYIDNSTVWASEVEYIIEMTRGEKEETWNTLS